jgi:CheY-like chemotaxis protein
VRILFLDDDLHRHRVFDRMHGPQTSDIVLHVWSSKEAIRALETGEPFDLLSLDHDLGNNIDCEVDEDTGYEVALFVRDHLTPSRFPRGIIIHSWNPAGARRMRLAIEQAGIDVYERPFSV